MAKGKTASAPKIEAVDQHTKYEYEYAPGESISLRVLSHRERARLFGGRFLILGRLIQRSQKKLISLFEEDVDGSVISSASMQELYKPLHDEMLELIQMIGLEQAAATVSEWNDFGDFPLIRDLYNRIAEVENALSTGKDVPEKGLPSPAEIDVLNDEEAEKLGEELPPSILPSGTLPSDAPAATSSSGAAITTE